MCPVSSCSNAMHRRSRFARVLRPNHVAFQIGTIGPGGVENEFRFVVLERKASCPSPATILVVLRQLYALQVYRIVSSSELCEKPLPASLTAFARDARYLTANQDRYGRQRQPEAVSMMCVLDRWARGRRDLLETREGGPRRSCGRRREVPSEGSHRRHWLGIFGAFSAEAPSHVSPESNLSASLTARGCLNAPPKHRTANLARRHEQPRASSLTPPSPVAEEGPGASISDKSLCRADVGTVDSRLAATRPTCERPGRQLPHIYPSICNSARRPALLSSPCLGLVLLLHPPALPLPFPALSQRSFPAVKLGVLNFLSRWWHPTLLSVRLKFSQSTCPARQNGLNTLRRSSR